jgi:uncharacterized protein YijF (DUF1287 family)
VLVLIQPTTAASVETMHQKPGQQAGSIARTAANKIVERARLEVTRGVRYDAAYRVVAYPGGDVPVDRGACTDVVIRALRAAGKDLQVLIHQDKVRNADRYPYYDGQGGTDKNIDHRRVPNHLVFLRRFGKNLSTGLDGAKRATWKPGDLVYVKLPSGLDHCGVVSDRLNREGLPLLIHNLGTAEEEDALRRWKIVAHFRYPVRD